MTRRRCPHCASNVLDPHHTPSIPCGMLTRDWSMPLLVIRRRNDGTSYVRWSGRTRAGAERWIDRQTFHDYDIIETATLTR